MGSTSRAKRTAPHRVGSNPAPSAPVHKIQPTPRSCGQTCLAMLLGVPVGDVFVKLVKSRGTTGRQLRRFLVERGRNVGEEQRYVGWLPAVALVRIEWPGPRARGHWIVRSNGRFYDPVTRDPNYAVRVGRIVSYIAVAPP